MNKLDTQLFRKAIDSQDEDRVLSWATLAPMAEALEKRGWEGKHPKFAGQLSRLIGQWNHRTSLAPHEMTKLGMEWTKIQVKEQFTPDFVVSLSGRLNAQKPRKKTKRPPKTELLCQIREYVRKHHKIRGLKTALAAHFGVSCGTIYNAIKEYDIDLKKISTISR